MEKTSIACKGQGWNRENEIKNEPRVLTIPSIFFPKAVFLMLYGMSESHGEAFIKMLIPKPYPHRL